MGVPPTPSNPYDAPTAAAGADGGAPTTTNIDIWGLGEYGKPGHKIIFGQVSTQGQNPVSPDSPLARHLPWEDREGKPSHSVADQRELLDVLKMFAGMPYTPGGQAKIEDYQRRLLAAGFYGAAKPEDVAWGSFDPATENAFRTALLSTYKAGEAGAPVSFDEYIDKTASGRAKGQTGAPVSVHELSNPRVVASVLQQTAQTVLGRNLTKDEVDHFVSDYMATEQEYYKAAEKATQGHSGLGEAGTDLIKPPSIEAAAQDTVMQDHGTEASGNRASDYLGVLEGLLSQGSVPTPAGV